MPSRPPSHSPARLAAPSISDALRRQADRERGSAASRGYDGKWRKARAQYLREHPLCARCQAEGRVTPATVVDHVVPHRGDKRLFWRRSNWQPLCAPHHDAKTAAEDGGFGRHRGGGAETQG